MKLHSRRKFSNPHPVVTTPLPPSNLNFDASETGVAGKGGGTNGGNMPNGHLMTPLTPHDQRRRAALLADSPELSTRPPLNAGGGSGTVIGVLQEAHTQMSSNAGSSSSTTSSIPIHNTGCVITSIHFVN